VARINTIKEMKKGAFSVPPKISEGSRKNTLNKFQNHFFWEKREVSLNRMLQRFQKDHHSFPPHIGNKSLRFFFIIRPLLIVQSAYRPRLISVLGTLKRFSSNLNLTMLGHLDRKDSLSRHFRSGTQGKPEYPPDSVG